MYNNTKIKRYQLSESIRDKVDSGGDFDYIDGFKASIKDYIYTDIKMTDCSESIEKAFQSRLQLLQSETLIRCLMLKEGMVLALNNNNFPTYYTTLKSFLEIPAVLGYVANLIYSDSDYEKIIPKINTLHLGNRDSGSLTTGSIKAINVLTMFKQLDKFIKNIACNDKSEKEREEILEKEDVITSIYYDVCNFGHTNFNANLSIGVLRKNDIWEAKKDSTGYKEELWSFYMTGFLMGIDVIQIISSLISKNKKVQNFNLLNNPYYFKK